MIREFRDEYFWLSNFAPASIPAVHFGYSIIWPTVEHAFQATKLINFSDVKEIYGCKQPGQAKRLARTMPMRADWDSIKIFVMNNYLQKKFLLNKEHMMKLMLTCKEELIEGNTWGDKFWGVDIKTGIGENWLGKSIMGLRYNLRKGILPSVVYTSQMRSDRPDAIDITVKNNPAHVLSPTWEMVQGIKSGELNEDQYRTKYSGLILERWKTRSEEFDEIYNLNSVVFKCFCGHEAFCHRNMAVALYETTGKFIYGGRL